MTISTDPHDESLTLDMSGATDPYPFFAYKRNTDPVWRGTIMDHSKTPPEMVPAEEWTLFDYDSVFAAFRNDELFGSHGYDHTIGLVLGPTILAMHGKQHHDHRSLVAKAFRASALARWEPSVIDPICDALVDEIKKDGAADLVRSLTFEFPTRVTAALLGLPQDDLDLFRRLSLELISIQIDIEAGLTASVALRDYFFEQVEQRRRRMTNDIIGDLVAAEIDGEKLTDDEIYAFIRLMLPAGVETTYRSSGNLLVALLTEPALLERVTADRSLLPNAIEEGLRWEPPITALVRHARVDTTLGGVEIDAGMNVNVSVASANRDSARYDDPERFVLDRTNINHLTFGYGAHLCLGMHLARMETRVALNALFDRLPNLRLDPDAEPPEITGVAFRSPASLQVLFDAC